METTSILTSSSYSSPYSSLPPHFNFHLYCFVSPSLYLSSCSSRKCRFPTSFPKLLISTSNFLANNNAILVTSHPRSNLRTSNFVVEEAASADSASPSSARDMLPKVDKSGRFCSPRSARELALSIVYAACLEGSDPVRLFEKRVNAIREPGYEFDKNLLLEYNHMSFGGPPVTVETNKNADELLRIDEQESLIEAEVLSAPPKLVYSKLILRFARKLLVAVVDRWDKDVLVIDKVAPANWKNEPAGRILELCILHLAMSEITVLGTRHPIVINEAVDLAKRFCDGAAPRIINGCLRTFVRDLERTSTTDAIRS